MDLQQLVADHPELDGHIHLPKPDTWVLELSGEIDGAVFEAIDESGIKISAARFDATHNFIDILHALETYHAFDSVHDLHLTRIDGLTHQNLENVLTSPATNHLRTLNLGMNNFDDSYVDTILDFARIDELEKLSLNHNEMTEAALLKITARDPQRLTVLNLADQGGWNDQHTHEAVHSSLVKRLDLLFVGGNDLTPETTTQLQFPEVDFDEEFEIGDLASLGRRATLLHNEHVVEKVSSKLSEFDDVEAVRELVRLLLTNDGAISVRNALVLSAYLEVSKLLIDGVLNILGDNKTLPVPVAQAIGEILAERIDGPIADLERLMEAFEAKGLPVQHLDSAVTHASSLRE